MEAATLQWAVERFDMVLLVHDASGRGRGAEDAWMLIREGDLFADWMADAARIEWRGAAPLCAVGRISLSPEEHMAAGGPEGGLLRRVEALMDHVVRRDREAPTWAALEGGSALPPAQALAAAKLLVGWNASAKALPSSDVLAASTEDRSALVFAADDMWRGLF
jgi:hypothetical protein